MNAKRWTICLLRGHKWNRIPYNDHDDGGVFLRCRVCAYENHSGSGVRPMGIG